MDLICVGEMVIDFLPGAEEGVYIRKAGGAPANVAVAAARNGLQVGFCGCVGNDDFGKFLTKTLTTNGVKMLVPRLVDDAVTTMAFVSLNEYGDRSFTFARKPGADMFLTCTDIDNAQLCNARAVHAGSCSLSEAPASEATMYAMKQAKDAGKLVSFDVNYRNLMWKDDRTACIQALQEALPLVDLLKISGEEADMLGGSLEEAAHKYQIAVLVETMGSAGAKCLWNGQELFVKGRPANCVDATGAGDAFWGGFLSCLLSGGVKSVEDITKKLLIQAMEYGNIAGWLCVQKKGAMESLPTTKDILKILEAEV